MQISALSTIYDAPSSEVDGPAADASKRYGGLGRSSYFLWNIGVQMLGFGLMGVLALFFNPETAVLAGYVVLFVGSLAVAAARYLNQGASPWWVLGYMVPLLNVYVSVRALSYPEGYADHRQLDLHARLILAGLALVLISVICGAIFLPMYASVAPH